MVKISLILKRVGTVIKLTTNKDIAAALGVPPATCSGWKKRNAIPWGPLFQFAVHHDISFDWLLTGRDRHGDGFGCTWDDETRKACEDVAEILRSGNKAARAALLSNLEAFKEMVRLDERVKHLERVINHKEKTESPEQRSASGGDDG